MTHRGSDAFYGMLTNDFPPENQNPNAREDGYNRAWGVSSDDTEPPSKKIRRWSPSLGTRKSRLKTQLCCKFRAGTCPYAASFCKFAHSVEELRRLPEESGRVYKGIHCKKFTSRQGCPYGETCTFLHDETRGSFAIGLGPPAHNFKTRICNKWADTGYCPFGWNCRFAHGPSDLHQSGGGDAEGEGSALGTKQTASVVTQNPSGVRTQRKWKGPNKISRIYGDWIDDIE